MNKLARLIFIWFAFFNFTVEAIAYQIPVYRFENEGSMYVESSSISRTGKSVTLRYIENFNQPQNYGELEYKSKATNIHIDCPDRRVFALSEAYYSDRNLSGTRLGAFALSDEFGSYAEHGSWVSEIVGIGCSYR